jgi:hypothetical protein
VDYNQAVLSPKDLQVKSAGNLGCPTGNLVDLTLTFVVISGGKRHPVLFS